MIRPAPNTTNVESKLCPSGQVLGNPALIIEKGKLGLKAYRTVIDYNRIDMNIKRNAFKSKRFSLSNKRIHRDSIGDGLLFNRNGFKYNRDNTNFKRVSLNYNLFLIMSRFNMGLYSFMLRMFLFESALTILLSWPNLLRVGRDKF